MDWTALLRRLHPIRPAGRPAWPGTLSLFAVLVIALFPFAWPSLRHGEAVAVAERSIQPQVALAQVQLPTPTTTHTPTPAAQASPTATLAASATGSPAGNNLTAPIADSERETAEETPNETREAEAETVLPPPPRGIGPRVNPRLSLLPATPTQADTPPATPTATPTLSIIAALQQPVNAELPGIGARLATPAVAPEATTPAPVTADAALPVAPPPPMATAAIAPTPDGNIRVARVPILMYHYLSVPPPNADIYRLDLSVTPRLFAEHLDAMQQAGYTTISLYQWLAHLTQGAPLPEKPVVLTFDDGYRDNYTNAFPLLRERGMVATFFIVSDFIDDGRPEYVTWDMVREMYAAGMSIESHGRNHVSLAGKSHDYLVWQALGSLETIEYELGVRPRFISYPAGEYDQRTIEIFRSADYWAGFTTRQGATHRSDDLFQARRVRVRGTTSATELLRLLALDW